MADERGPKGHPGPIVDPTRCAGHGRCVEACPTRALALVNGRAVVLHPERCTYCSACEDLCPEGAIALPFQVVLAPQGTPRGEAT